MRYIAGFSVDEDPEVFTMLNNPWCVYLTVSCSCVTFCFYLHVGEIPVSFTQPMVTKWQICSSRRTTLWQASRTIVSSSALRILIPVSRGMSCVSLMGAIYVSSSQCRYRCHTNIYWKTTQWGNTFPDPTLKVCDNIMWYYNCRYMNIERILFMGVIWLIFHI